MGAPIRLTDILTGMEANMQYRGMDTHRMRWVALLANEVWLHRGGDEVSRTQF